MIMGLLFATISTSSYFISIALHYAFAIVCTFVAYCTSNYISMDSRSSFATTLSSLASFCTVCASTKWCSSASSSSDSLMHIKSLDVTPSLIYFLAHQHHLLLHKISTINVPVVSMSWIIVYANCIFSLYAFLSAHSKDDDECSSNLIASGWIFNILLSAFLNSFSNFVLFNNSTSSSYLRLCSLLCASFSLAICYSFSIALFALILLWNPKLQKCT